MAFSKECGTCTPRFMLCKIKALPAEDTEIANLPAPGVDKEYFKVQYRWCLTSMQCNNGSIRTTGDLRLRGTAFLGPSPTDPRDLGGVPGVGFEPVGYPNFDQTFVEGVWTESVCCDEKSLSRSCVPLNPPTRYAADCCNTYLAELVKCCAANKTAAWGNNPWGALDPNEPRTCHSVAGPTKASGSSGECCKTRELFLPKPRTGTFDQTIFNQSILNLTRTISLEIQKDLVSEFSILIGSCGMRDSAGMMVHDPEQPCFSEYTAKCPCVGSPPNKCP